MGTVFLKQEHRDRYQDYEAPREMVDRLKGAKSTVQALELKPRLLERAVEHYAIVRHMFAAYVNSGLCRFAVPGVEVTPCDVIDVNNLLPVILVWRFSIFNPWQEKYRASGQGRPETPQPNLETLCWLMGYVFTRNYAGRSWGNALPKFTDEAQAKVQRTSFTDAEVDEQRARMNYPKWESKA